MNKLIELENLNDRPLTDILDEYKKQIMYINPDWTDFQEADPGITLIELFAWLKSVQHEYLNRKFPGVKRKFLKLLDISMEKNRGSETFLRVSGISKNIIIPSKSPWKVGDMIFENIHHQTLINSNILSVCFENPENKSEEEYYKFDGTRKYFVFGKDISRKNYKDIERSFTINFDSPLPEKSDINIYFSIYLSKGLKRNPIINPNEFDSMAKVKWEYYGIKNGKKGWHKVKVISDNTYNFLFSGVIKLNFEGEQIPLGGEYKIKATLLYDEYDYPPRIDNILTNVFPAVQTETKCENTIIKKSDVLSNRTFKIYNSMAVYGRSHVYYKKHGGWVKTDLPTFKSDMKNGYLIVDVNDIWGEVEDFKSNEEIFMVVSFDNKIKDKLCLGSGTGMSHQMLEFDAKNILDDEFEIMISEFIEGEEVFYKWKSVEDLYSSGKYDRHYVVNKENNNIFFGDHIHGVAPRKGDKNIVICSLKYTYGDKSNINGNMISSTMLKNKILQKARVEQITRAVGGQDSETLEHAEARAANLFSKPGRAVTVEDYKEIVSKTPGLMFTNVRILPGYMPGEDTSKQNSITVAVRWNRKIGLTLPKSFESNIMRQIDKYRLINTKVKVVSPEYIGLIITGEIVVDSFYRESDGFIEKEIAYFIENINSELGQTLHFGDLFGMIDKLKYVYCLDKLRITPIGNNVQKNVSEDIIITPNGVYYIEKIDFNYKRSTEIYRS